jgi:RND family efflux transporter MFP subunit
MCAPVSSRVARALREARYHARPMTPRLLGLLALVAAGAAGCGSDHPATAQQRPPAAASPAAREARVVPAAAARVARTVVASGALAAEEQTVLGAKVPGRLAEIMVDLGSRVRKGDVVARVDVSDYRLRLEQAQAALKQARARLGLPTEGTSDHFTPEDTALVRQARAVLDEARLTRDRMEKLWEQQLVARAQLDTAVAALQVAEGRYQDAIEEVRNRHAVIAQRRSEVDLAQQQLSDTVLVSPMDSAVSQRQASVGEYVAAGTPVVTLVRIHPLRLRLAVPEREAADVRVGQPVRLTVEGDATVYDGRVARLAPAITEQNRTLLVEAEVPNARGLLRPGAFAKAQIVTAADERVVMVPASAIVNFAGIEKVLTVEDGKVVEKRVQTGRRDGDSVHIAAGLAAGELVVMQPGNLVGGQPIVPIR